MEEDKSPAIKIYFIEPSDLISILIDALINLEYEVYIVSFEDKYKLLRIIQNELRTIIFFSIHEKNKISEYIEYVKKAQDIQNVSIQFAAFVFDAIKEDATNQFISFDIPVIKFSEAANNALEVLNKIFNMFDTKGKRSFIKVKTFGTAEAFFNFKNKGEPIICNILDVSANAFSVKVDPVYSYLFEVNSYIENVTVVLQGVRIRVAVKVIGYNSEKTNIYFLKFCSERVQDNKSVFVDTISTEAKIKIHSYIKKCLKHEISEKFNEITVE